MFQSRCGVCCDDCQRKEAVHCSGCLNMAAPFWGGACGVKSCCEEKTLDHCGICTDFPCDMLSNMGVDQGFDPKPKLEQCRKWRDEK